VSLIVQAGAIGGRGEIFVLDMGEPVKILDLARNMIRLSGQEPDRDIPIEFVGARAGEKLHEELWGEGEEVGETPHPKIQRARRPPIDAAWLEGELADLEHLVEEGDTLGLVARLSQTAAWGSGRGRRARTSPRVCVASSSSHPPQRRHECRPDARVGSRA
jgi:FlaA1/EpsC-like NDP-sugar epimerase